MRRRPGGLHGSGLHLHRGLTAEAAAPEFRGLAMGGYNAAIYLGMMLSSASMGPVIGWVGFTDGFLLTALINLILVACFYLLLRGFAPPKKALP